MQSSTVPVLIVGAGPSGLAAAIELGHRNIPCLLIERNDRVGYAPRAKTTHTRTREHLRRWGIADDLAQASPFGVDYPSDVSFVTRLAGHELTRIKNAFNCAPARNDLYSEHAQWIPQYKLEEVLRRHADTLDTVTLTFNRELVSFEEEEGGIVAVIRDVVSGDQYAISCQFLIGADGARSLVRDIIGAKMEGNYGLSRNYNIIFRAPGLAEAHAHDPAIMYWQVNADAPSLIGPMDRDDLWFFMPTGVAGDTVDDAEATRLIHRSTGLDTPVEIRSADVWVASQLVADRYQSGRAFLIGDACHLHPPFGGYGMNMGVADGVDLGWKLAAMLQGWGGPALAASYQSERGPLHRSVIDEAVANHAVLGNQLWRSRLEDDTIEGAEVRREVGLEIARAKAREFKSLGVVLGGRYHASAILAYEPGQPRRETLSSVYEPSSEPGSLAPHLWLDDGLSLYDLFGPAFTLLAIGEFSSSEADAVRADAARRGVPIEIRCLDDGRLPSLYGQRLTLIRPDQHVAWRGAVWPGPEVLDQVTGWAQALDS